MSSDDPVGLLKVTIMFTCFLIDIEGTIVKDKSYAPVAGAVEWLKKVNFSGRKFSLVTNNTTHSPEKLLSLLRSKGFELGEDNLDTCMRTAKEWLKKRKVRTCFVIGNNVLKNYLRKAGISIREDGLVQAVVVGLDEKINYQKIKIATRALVEKDAYLIALHSNKVFKDSKGEIAPSVGSMVKALEFASDKKAFIMGKPSKDFYRNVLRRLNSKPQRCLFISDDPISDLAGAKKLKIKTAFVLSGKYKRPVLRKLDRKVKPDYVYQKISEIKV